MQCYCITYMRQWLYEKQDNLKTHYIERHSAKLSKRQQEFVSQLLQVLHKHGEWPKAMGKGPIPGINPPTSYEQYKRLMPEWTRMHQILWSDGSVKIGLLATIAAGEGSRAYELLSARCGPNPTFPHEESDITLWHNCVGNVNYEWPGWLGIEQSRFLSLSEFKQVLIDDAGGILWRDHTRPIRHTYAALRRSWSRLTWVHGVTSPIAFLASGIIVNVLHWPLPTVIPLGLFILLASCFIYYWRQWVDPISSSQSSAINPIDVSGSK